MIGHQIMLDPDPDEIMSGILSDPSGLGILPGTHVQIKAAVADDGNGLTWQVYDTASDGKPRLVALLLEGYANGWQSADKKIQDGDMCRVWCPQNGDKANIRVGKAGTATTDAIAVGDVLMLDDGTGVAIADSSGDRKPWQAIEHVKDVVAMTSGGTLVACIFTGN